MRLLMIGLLAALASCSEREAPMARRKIVFVAGTPSHGPGEHEYFAGLTILAKMLAQSPNVETVIARNGWPSEPASFFLDASAIVVFSDGGGGHPLLDPDRAAVIDRELARGAGFACLHWAVEFVAREDVRARGWLGGYYRDGYSINPVWTASFIVDAHPITRGVAPFGLRDEWYFGMRFVDPPLAATPLLRAVPPEELRTTPETKEHPGRAETIAWAFERPSGGRSFGYTGGHFHDNWGDHSARRLVTNALLWIAHVDIPADGAPVEMDPSTLRENLDAK
jgi:type 1 glutamine amidotransferase